MKKILELPPPPSSHIPIGFQWDDCIFTLLRGYVKTSGGLFKQKNTSKRTRNPTTVRFALIPQLTETQKTSPRNLSYVDTITEELRPNYKERGEQPWTVYNSLLMGENGGNPSCLKPPCWSQFPYIKVHHPKGTTIFLMTLRPAISWPFRGVSFPSHHKKTSTLPPQFQMLHKHRKKATVVLLSSRPTTQCSWPKTTGTVRESWCPKLGTIYKPTIKGLATAAGFVFHKGPMILVKKWPTKKCSFKVFYRSVILYPAKLQYFTNLDLPEISGFPSSATNLEGCVRSQVVQDSSINSRTHVMVYLSYILVHIYDPKFRWISVTTKVTYVPCTLI